MGGLIGSESMKKEGAQQNAEGKGQEAQGQLSDFGSGVEDRVKGAVGGMAAGITGDREKEEEMRMKHDDAKTKQRNYAKESMGGLIGSHSMKNAYVYISFSFLLLYKVLIFLAYMCGELPTAWVWEPYSIPKPLAPMVDPQKGCSSEGV
ncbi:MAG: hypothetical protein Q9205_005789 [Flavoplaca limonia]